MLRNLLQHFFCFEYCKKEQKYNNVSNNYRYYKKIFDWDLNIQVSI